MSPTIHTQSLLYIRKESLFQNEQRFIIITILKRYVKFLRFVIVIKELPMLIVNVWSLSDQNYDTDTFGGTFHGTFGTFNPSSIVVIQRSLMLIIAIIFVFLLRKNG